MNAVSFQQVTVRYGSGRRKVTALDAFDDVIPAGGWTCIIGPNGAGKSSALRAAVGLVAYTGMITVDGQPLADDPRQRAQTVAYVPQTPLIADSMTAFDYVLLGRTPHIGYFATESARDRAIVEDTLTRLDLEDFADREMGALSGGERQRLVIARAVAQQARVLLLDEPTSALDIGHQRQALDLVARMSRDCGLTVLSVTHDLTLAGLYADRLVLLDGGSVVASGAPSEVLTVDTLQHAYGTGVQVLHAPDGTLVVAPRR